MSISVFCGFCGFRLDDDEDRERRRGGEDELMMCLLQHLSVSCCYELVVGEVGDSSSTRVRVRWYPSSPS